jgi:hypothetical protein
MSDTDGDILKNVHSLLILFGERYIHTSTEQALLDCQYSRENMIAAFDAIASIADDTPKIESEVVR